MNDPSASIPLAQMFLSWTLLGVLLAWMFLFAFLAFRSQKAEIRDTADLPTPSGAFPAIVPRTPLHRPSVPVEVSSDHAPAIVSQQSPADVGAAPVA